LISRTVVRISRAGDQKEKDGMAQDRRISRREVMKRTLAVLPLAAGSGYLLSACGEKALDCTDVSTLTDAERTARTNLAYADASPHGEQKHCLNCRFYQGGPDACGTCQLVKGPINPKGYCNSWVAKA
jgi:hypothetical protein